MRRDSRRIPDDGLDSKKITYIAIGVLALAILAFIITFYVYGNSIDEPTKLSEFNSENLELNTEIEETSTQYGKTVNEVKEETNDEADNETNEEENVTKVAINTSTVTNKEENTSSSNEGKSNETKKENEEEKVKDPTFMKPVQGDIIKEFAKSKLVYSDTLEVWTTHNGIDIKADKTSIVKAAAEGTVKSIKNDPRYGLTIVIEHVNGYETVYSNLLSTEFVVEGEKVKQNQTIGTVGNTATFEIADEPHLHFELIKDNEQLDPTLYIK